MLTKHTRWIDATKQRSSSQAFLTAKPAVAVEYVGHKAFDAEDLQKAAARAVNLQLLLEHLFGGDVAQLAARAEIDARRLRGMLDLESHVSSEMAEHIEQTLRLPAGWLDQRRNALEAADIALLQQRMGGGADAPNDAVAATKHGDSDDAIAARKENAGSAAMPVNKENTMPKVVLGAELQWIKERLDAMPRGSKTRLADLMHRHPNDLSAWLGSHRPMPESAKQALAAALPAFDERMAADFRAAFPHSDIAGWMDDAAKAEQENTQDLTAASDPQAPATKEAAAPETKPAVLVKRRAGSGTYVSFRRNEDGPTLEEVIAQTANTLAHVLDRLSSKSQHENQNH
jgi:hypothetical protein